MVGTALILVRHAVTVVTLFALRLIASFAALHRLFPRARNPTVSCTALLRDVAAGGGRSIDSGLAKALLILAILFFINTKLALFTLAFVPPLVIQPRQLRLAEAGHVEGKAHDATLQVRQVQVRRKRTVEVEQGCVVCGEDGAEHRLT